ncbi:helix-turn-helix domain-containing protein [Kineosporia rhizophila]|uniref:helix-turn-helix domain-containing protein n=1 Tax=Kineosporia TaxID=49184 RepID=UPI000B0742D8|nr:MULTISPECIES: helix-turn-helix transcriptional regulator [Kineosporia]MCE0539253.1 helix-turn-helix domain-containing protein [Kineosporia rhizophila]GLY14476.1 hypothetical protein Kisp01_14910 [Kineosporia sp. NBRC 101677]
MTEAFQFQPSALARRLSDLRASRPGLTQEALARAFTTERKVSAPTLSHWESDRKTPTAERLDAYARLFATDRAFIGPVLRPLSQAELAEDADDLDRYRTLHDELLNLLQAGEDDSPLQRTLLQFDEGDIVIVCPEAPGEVQGALADPASPNYARLHRYADPDALIETFGHLRALNPDRKVFYRVPGNFARGDLQNHLILIGGIGWSKTTRQIYSKINNFPVSQIEHEDVKTGAVFRVNDQDKIFFPQFDEESGEVIEDVAMIARVRNPFNSNRTLTMLNGIHSRGVLAAALAVTDETIRAGNEEFLAQRFPSGDFCLLMRVDIVARYPLAPDFRNESARLFEWSPGDVG